MTILPSSRAYIRTTYLGATNNRGARIKATCQAGSVTIPYPYELDCNDAHAKAAQTLIELRGLDWGNQFAVGGDDKGLVFVPISQGCNVWEVQS